MPQFRADCRNTGPDCGKVVGIAAQQSETPQFEVESRQNISWHRNLI